MGARLQLSIESIHVPLSQREVFIGLANKRSQYNTIEPPRFSVSVAYGQRYEPWIESVSELKASN